MQGEEVLIGVHHWDLDAERRAKAKAEAERAARLTAAGVQERINILQRGQGGGGFLALSQVQKRTLRNLRTQQEALKKKTHQR